MPASCSCRRSCSWRTRRGSALSTNTFLIILDMSHPAHLGRPHMVPLKASRVKLLTLNCYAYGLMFLAPGRGTAVVRSEVHRALHSCVRTHPRAAGRGTEEEDRKTKSYTSKVGMRLGVAQGAVVVFLGPARRCPCRQQAAVTSGCQYYVYFPDRRPICVVRASPLMPRVFCLAKATGRAGCQSCI